MHESRYRWTSRWLAPPDPRRSFTAFFSHFYRDFLVFFRIFSFRFPQKLSIMEMNRSPSMEARMVSEQTKLLFCVLATFSLYPFCFCFLS